MTVYNYNKILERAKTCQTNTKKEYKTGISSWWSYYIAKQIINPKKDVTVINISDAPNPTGSSISRQIDKADYLDMCKRLIRFVETYKKMPNYVTYMDYEITPRLLTEILSRILIYYDTYKTLPAYANANSKVFTKPIESGNSVYDYFVKVFGKITCIDDALEKISGRGYGYYYDDRYTNKESIDRMKNRKGVNCTDSCHVFYNLGQVFVKQGKYKKVECLHVKCKGGDGHVRLRFTKPDGNVFYRDPACTLSSGGTCNWCLNGTLLAVNPGWFLANLKR